MRNFEIYSQKRRAALRRKRIVCALCAAVVLGAGWVLMRPAITLSDQPECGLEEHTHLEDCYSQETGPAPLVCTLEYHEHGDDCFDAEGNLLCEQQEHVHSESCYGEPETYPLLTCTIPEHTHSDDCYPVPEPTPAYTVGPVLDCGMAEHVHGEGCYDGEDLICTIPEHTHTDSCYPQQETQQTQPDEEPQPDEEIQETEAPEETEEPLSPLDALRQRLGIETEEEAAALDALLEKYALEPGEILEYLTYLAENPEMEQITDFAGLKALVESAYDVSLLAAEDGVFHKVDPLNIGLGYSAEVTVDGITFTAIATHNTPSVEGCYLQITKNDVNKDSDGGTEFAPLHGVLYGMKSYSVQIVKDDKTTPFEDPYMPTLTISGPNSETMYIGNETFAPVGVQGADGTWYPRTDISYSIMPDSGMPMPSGKVINLLSFDSIAHNSTYKGSYEIGYILKNYNVFVADNYIGTHVVGPMIVGGRAYRWNQNGEGGEAEDHSSAISLGGLSTVGYPGSHNGAPHQVPSYFGNTSATQIITGNPTIPVYVGTADLTMSVESWNGGLLRTSNYIYTTTGYVNFTAAMDTIKGQMNAIVPAGAGSKTMFTELEAGGTYVFDASAIASEKTELVITGDPAKAADTTIIIKGANVKLPHITSVCGTPTASIEYGQGSGIVFLCPEAETVTGWNITGHVVAPDAYVKYIASDGTTSGYYNGCVIAKKFHSGGAEGHMWPYSGQSFIPTEPIQNEVQVNAGKQLNGADITDTALQFNFSLYRQDEDEDKKLVYTTKAASAVNKGSSVVFRFGVSTSGDYVYKMVEDCDETQRADHPGVLFDTRAFYVKVHVDESLNATITYYSDEACTKELGEGQVPTFNNRFGEKLPDTGGPGTLGYILPGIFLTALAITGACITRKRRAV